MTDAAGLCRAGADDRGSDRAQESDKKWNRAWKIELIEGSNPDWLDLFETII
jgi:predicted GIY-YIG superfamily endonuclease